MVVQRTVEKLRGRPKDERIALAGGIAIAVIVILFIGWIVFFLHGLRGSQQVQYATESQVPTATSTEQ